MKSFTPITWSCTWEAAMKLYSESVVSDLVSGDTDPRKKSKRKLMRQLGEWARVWFETNFRRLVGRQITRGLGG